MAPTSIPDWNTGLNPAVQRRIREALTHGHPHVLPLWEHISHPGLYYRYKKAGDSPLNTATRMYHDLGVDICRGYSVPSDGEGAPQAKNGLTVAELRGELDGKERDWDAFIDELTQQYSRVRDAFAPRTLYVPTGGTGLTDLYVSAGYEQFCLWLHDYPSLIEDVLERRLRHNLRWTRRVAREELCPVFFLGEDVACRDRLLFSPDWLRRHFIPALERLIRSLHGANITVIFHSDGDLMDILDDLVDAGIDGLHPIEPAAGMDLTTVKRRYGDQLVLVGNVDCTHLLPSASGAEIRDAVRECVEIAGKDGGYCLGSSGEIHAGIPIRNVDAYFRACRHCAHDTK